MSNFTIIKKERCYDGYIKVDKMTVAIDKKEIKLEIIERGESVALLIVDPITHDCIVTRQFRPAIENYLDGPVAGMIDEGESESQAMIRELLEETGISLSESDLIRCGRHYLSAGVMTEATTCFIAFMPIKSKHFPYTVNNVSESEFLEVDSIPLSDIMADDNKQASMTICALYAEKELSKMR